MDGRHLGVEDGLLALEDRNRLLVLVDVEILGRQICDRVAVSGLDREVNRHVRGPMDRMIDQLQLEARASGGGDQECAGKTDK